MKALGLIAGQLKLLDWRSGGGHEGVTGDICGDHIARKASEGRDIQGRVFDEGGDVNEVFVTGRRGEFELGYM